MQYLKFDVFEKSINTIETASGSAVVFMAKENKKKIFVIQGKNASSLGFNAQVIESGILRADLNHENACVLRKIFPFTAPVRGLRKNTSFGLGDRLGIATSGHLRLFEKNDVFPVFAQQSVRELNLTNRTYEEVLDAVSFAVYREGFKKGFGADGDHLKTAKDIEYALSLGFTMITLDCSDHIKNENPQSYPQLSKYYADKYLNRTFIIEDTNLVFTEEELKQCISIYKEAVLFAEDIYNRFFASGKYNADLEISIDETESVTTPLAHFFAARELLDLGVSFASLAPRFCGEFQKGIDYKGDLTQFENEIKIHAAIARHFGYKLSIHSGSDKFRVFPVISRQTGGRFHIKTAGTSWLEALRIAAEFDPSLYREIHLSALTVFGDAKKNYHVTAALSEIPDISFLKDEELHTLFENDNARQLLHITYGQILNKKNNDGSFVFKDRLYTLWQSYENEYFKALEKHIGKHLELLNI